MSNIIKAIANVIENISNLLKVKTIVTICVIASYVALSLRGTITPDNVMIIVTAVVSFYFGTVNERNNNEK